MNIHKILTGEGAEVYLPLALARVRFLARSFNTIMEQTFKVDDAVIRIRTDPASGQHFVRIDADGPFYEFFTPERTLPWLSIQPGSVTSLGGGSNVRAICSTTLSGPGIRTNTAAIGPGTVLSRTWAAFNGQRLPEYVHWTANANKTIVGWTASTAISHSTEQPWAYDSGRLSTVQRPFTDVGLDLAPTFHRAGQAPIRKVPADFDALADSGVDGTGAPIINSRIYYGRACVQRASSDVYGTRDFFVMTDSYNNFYIYPVKDDGTDTPLVDSGGVKVFDFTYSHNFKKIAAPLPDWAAVASESTQVNSYGSLARHAYDPHAPGAVSPDYTAVARVVCVPPNPTEPKLYNLYRYKWAFNSTSTKAVAVVSTIPMDDPSGTQRFVGFQSGLIPTGTPADNPSGWTTEVRKMSFPGVVEVNVNITITGDKIGDFTATVTPSQSLNSLVTNNYYLAADYAYADSRLEALGVMGDSIVTAELQILQGTVGGTLTRGTQVVMGVLGQPPAVKLLARTNIHSLSTYNSHESVVRLEDPSGNRLGLAHQVTDGWVDDIPGADKRYEGITIHSIDLRSLSAILELHRNTWPIGTLIVGPRMYYWGSAVISHGAVAQLDDGFINEDFFNVPLAAPQLPIYDAAANAHKLYQAEATWLGLTVVADNTFATARGVINSHPYGHVAFQHCPAFWFYAADINGILNSFTDRIERVHKDETGAIIGTTVSTHMDAFNKAFAKTGTAARDYSYYMQRDGKYGSFCTMGVWSRTSVKYNLPKEWGVTA